LVADLKAVLDSLQFKRVNLAGHSIAGAELTRFAMLYPGRVASLTYIDALLQVAGLERLVAEDTIRVKATEADLGTYESARDWFERCFFGFWSPALEADFRFNTTESATTDTIFRDAVRNPAWRPEYSRIRAPTLVLHTFATLERRRPCVAKSPDRERVRRATAFIDKKWRPFQRAGIEMLRRQRPDARIVELNGHHFLFVSNQNEVVSEMRQFLLNKPTPQ
jgi:pimeloyl-ACP methyl ester carboxylesterase